LGAGCGFGAGGTSQRCGLRRGLVAFVALMKFIRPFFIAAWNF